MYLVESAEVFENGHATLAKSFPLLLAILLALEMIQHLIEFMHLAVFLVFSRELSLFFQLDEFSLDFLDWGEVLFARGDRLVKQAHLELTEGLVKVESAVTPDKLLPTRYVS